MADFNPLAEFRQSLSRNSPCTVHPPLARSDSPEMAALWAETVELCNESARREHLRWLARNDLFFLCVYILNRKHFIDNPRRAAWTFQRCNEVQDDPNNYVDLWPRESFKSEIISFGLTIQDILNDPEVTFGIFSHNRPMAKDFLVVIKRELGDNEKLKGLFPEILWQNPKTETIKASVSWSENEGITVKRKGNPKEATIEAWGLTDGQPTGKRYKKLLYEDVVNRDAISEMMMVKTTVEFENSLLLTASDPPIARYVATFQEIGDTTQQIIDRKMLRLRKRPPIDDEGKPAYCSDEKFTWFKKNLSNKTFALQILLDPTKAKDESDIGFHQDWLVYYPEDDLPSRRGMNVYVLVDPAGNSTESNSRNVIAAVGLTADRRAWLLDMVWDKMDLEECWLALFDMVQRWTPTRVGYEKFGMQRDIEHFHYRMKEANYPFTIVPLGGTHLSKNQRIERLIPWCRDRRLLLPKKGIHKTLKDGTKIDLVKQFVEHEYLVFPYSGKLKDMLDALALIANPDLGITFPRSYGSGSYGEGGRGGYDGDGGGGNWMTG
jgi:hypothetical protein